MESFEKLQNKMRELESETEHKGYYYKVSDALTIMICGMLCNLQNISDIHEWAQAEPVRDFLYNKRRCPPPLKAAGAIRPSVAG